MPVPSGTLPESLTPVTSIDQLDQLVAESIDRPVLLFKHSRSCGTSAQAFDELLDHLSGPRLKDATHAVITVQTHRDVSTAAAARLGIRHETPQALLLRDGRVVWSASHFRVTAAAIAAALQHAASTTSEAAPRTA
jgi:bacillithiol system protein YtxJ